MKIERVKDYNKRIMGMGNFSFSCFKNMKGELRRDGYILTDKNQHT